MKASELRVGNYLFTYVGAVLNTKSLVCVDTNHIRHIADGNLFEYEPIPLTEYWLVRFGFEGNYWPGEDYIAHHPKLKDCEILLRHHQFRINSFIVREMQYVHQLQNLYNALTGQELELKNG